MEHEASTHSVHVEYHITTRFLGLALINGFYVDEMINKFVVKRMITLYIHRLLKLLSLGLVFLFFQYVNKLWRNLNLRKMVVRKIGKIKKFILVTLK